jgi:hypothetical protein
MEVDNPNCNGHRAIHNPHIAFHIYTVDVPTTILEATETEHRPKGCMDNPIAIYRILAQILFPSRKAILVSAMVASS